jgi:hypothetical protein
MSDNVALYGPYEQLGIAACRLIEKIIDGQPPEVKKQLWEWYIEDMRGWREFGSKTKQFFTDRAERGK